MPKIYELEYEFSDYDEAMLSIKKYALSKPPNVAPYPYFEIDRVQVDTLNKLVIWLKVRPND